MSELEDFLVSGEDLKLTKRVYTELAAVIRDTGEALSVNQVCFVLSTLLIEKIGLEAPEQFRDGLAEHVCTYIKAGVGGLGNE
jgi:hypothetical protein